MKDIFTPHQPFLEYNRNYKSITPMPGSPLCGIVWEVYQVDFFDSTKRIVIPDMSADLMAFYSKDSMIAYMVGGDSHLASMEKVDFIDNVDTIFGVKFCTGSVGNLCRQSIADISSCIIDGVDALFNGNDVIGRLEEADAFSKRWEIVESYLMERLEKNYTTNILSKCVSGAIIRNHGKVNMQDLEDYTGYSERYIRKVMKEEMGISVKQLCQIVQFQWTYHLYKEELGNVTWTDLALESGYYDQSHMNLSIKNLTGFLPRQILSLYMN